MSSWVSNRYKTTRPELVYKTTDKRLVVTGENDIVLEIATKDSLQNERWELCAGPLTIDVAKLIIAMRSDYEMLSKWVLELITQLKVRPEDSPPDAIRTIVSQIEKYRV